MAKAAVFQQKINYTVIRYLITVIVNRSKITSYSAVNCSFAKNNKVIGN